MRRFLIVKTSSLGDIIQTFPVISYLKQKIPDVQIDWVVEKPFADLLKAHPDIHRVLCIHTKRWRQSPFSKQTQTEFTEFRNHLKQTVYDAVFDLQSNIKSSCITWLSNSPAKVGFGRHSVHEWPNLFVTNKKYDPPKGVNIREDYLHVVQGFFEEYIPFQEQGVALKVNVEQQHVIDGILASEHLVSQPRVMVCAGANWKNKQLTTDTIIEFLHRMHHAIHCSFLLSWGTESEREVALQINRKLPACSVVIPLLPLAVLQNLMSKIDLVMAMDSLPLHLAATTSTPSYSIFGPSLASKFKPMGERHHAFQGECPYHRTFEKRCSILRSCPTGACMRQLRAPLLLEDFLSWWKTRSLSCK